MSSTKADEGGDLIEQLGPKARGVCADGLRAGYPQLSGEQWHYLPAYPAKRTPAGCARAVEALGNATGWSMLDWSFKDKCSAAVDWCYYFTEPFSADDDDYGADYFYGKAPPPCTSVLRCQR